MSNRAAVALLAVALIAGALIAAFVPVHANGISCGAAFSSGTDDAFYAQYGDDIADAAAGADLNSTDYAADCSSRRDTQRAFVIPLLIVAALGGGYLLLTARRTDPADQSPRAK